MFTLKLSKGPCPVHRSVKKALENIIKLRTQNKAKAFKKLLLRDECKLM